MKPLTTEFFSFHKSPFVFVALALFTGVVAGYFWQSLAGETVSVFVLLALIFVGLYLLMKVRKAGLIAVLTVFTAIGVLGIWEKMGALEKSTLADTYTKGDVYSVRLTEVGSSGKWVKATGKVECLYTGKRSEYRNTRVLLFIRDQRGLPSAGDVLISAALLDSITNNGNPGEFDARGFWNKKGIFHMAFIGTDEFKVLDKGETGMLTGWLNACRDYLVQVMKDNLSGDELAVGLALVLGDKSLLDQEIRNSFTNTGAMHVLAVSGLHVGIIMQILLFIFGLFPQVISRRSAILVVVVLMWAYAFITGMSPSVLRAVFMFSVLVISQLGGRSYDNVNVLFFTGFTLVLLDPFTLFDIGFQLSFLAMLGIFLFYRHTERLIYVENVLLKKIWQGTAIGFAAQMMTTPLSLYYFHQFPNYFIVTNIGLMASSGLILGGGLLLFSVSWLPFLARLTGLLMGLVIGVSVWFIRWVESLPGAVAYGFEPGLLTVMLLGVLFIWFNRIESARWRSVFTVCGVGLLITMVWKRYENLNRDEVVFYNARQLIITIRHQGEIFCFYRAKPEEVDKVRFAVDSYRKIHPGNVYYFPLDEKNWQLSRKGLEVESEYLRALQNITVNGKKYVVQFSNKGNLIPSGKEDVTLAMPWVNKPSDHALGKGALVRDI